MAIKELALRRVRDAKTRELIDREIRVLRELRHPAVPRLHEVVETGVGRARTLWLVLDLIDGVPLDRFWTRPAAERSVLEVLWRTAEVLADLHALRPPVIHRDLKPANLLRRPDGRIALVDFGSVRDVVVVPGRGSTVVGTFGYTAPEQLQGDASPASDLYALGATAVHLLAGQPPHRLLDRAGHLRWRDAVHVSVGLGGLLDDLLRPNPAERASDAQRVAESARWLLSLRPRAGSMPPAVRTLPAVPPTNAPRSAEPLVDVLFDAYDGIAPPPRPDTGQVQALEPQSAQRRATLAREASRREARSVGVAFWVGVAMTLIVFVPLGVLVLFLLR